MCVNTPRYRIFDYSRADHKKNKTVFIMVFIDLLQLMVLEQVSEKRFLTMVLELAELDLWFALAGFPGEGVWLVILFSGGPPPFFTDISM